MTLLDEFEKNVETVIGILENGVSIIDQWFKDLPKFSETGCRFITRRTARDVLSILESFHPFADLFPEIQRFLITHIPQFEGRIKKRDSDINEKIEEIVGKCGQHPLNSPHNPSIPGGKMNELKHNIENLIGDLRFCVKIAKGQLVAGTQPLSGGNADANLPDYRAFNLAQRTITIGAKTYPITSEKVWDFLKDLCSNLRYDRITAYVEGERDNKNAVDQLRKQIGNDNLHKLVIPVKGSGYKLNTEVKILYSGQKGIRKTRLK